jgi:hypothetical protein
MLIIITFAESCFHPHWLQWNNVEYLKKPWIMPACGGTWGDQIRGSNLVGMFLIIAFVTKMNVKTMKGYILDMGKLNAKSAYHRHLCWHIQFLTLWVYFCYCTNNVKEDVWFHFKWALHSLLGVATMVYQAPQFFIETLAIFGIQLTTMFCPIATLCKGGGTPWMVVTSKDHLVSTIIS